MRDVVSMVDATELGVLIVDGTVVVVVETEVLGDEEGIDVPVGVTVTVLVSTQ